MMQSVKQIETRSLNAEDTKKALSLAGKEVLQPRIAAEIPQHIMNGNALGSFSHADNSLVGLLTYTKGDSPTGREYALRCFAVKGGEEQAGLTAARRLFTRLADIVDEDARESCIRTTACAVIESSNDWLKGQLRSAGFREETGGRFVFERHYASMEKEHALLPPNLS